MRKWKSTEETVTVKTETRGPLSVRQAEFGPELQDRGDVGRWGRAQTGPCGGGGHPGLSCEAFPQRCRGRVTPRDRLVSLLVHTYVPATTRVLCVGGRGHVHVLTSPGRERKAGCSSAGWGRGVLLSRGPRPD